MPLPLKPPPPSSWSLASSRRHTRSVDFYCVPPGPHSLVLSRFKQHLLAATKLPEPEPTAFLYLSQLTEPEQSLTCFNAALTIFKTRLQSIQVDLNVASNGKEKEWSQAELELRRSASRALIGMTELYLTELWSAAASIKLKRASLTIFISMEDDAEQKCDGFLQEALFLDPTDPEVYQTLASVRLSQQRNEEAVQMLHQAWTLWKDLDTGVFGFCQYFQSMC